MKRIKNMLFNFIQVQTIGSGVLWVQFKVWFTIFLWTVAYYIWYVFMFFVNMFLNTISFAVNNTLHQSEFWSNLESKVAYRWRSKISTLRWPFSSVEMNNTMSKSSTLKSYSRCTALHMRFLCFRSRVVWMEAFAKRTSGVLCRSKNISLRHLKSISYQFEYSGLANKGHEDVNTLQRC